jgi:TPP-dependent pyruvate/acetoin dehydrogenase alpha subunit
VPRSSSTSVASNADRAAGYGIPGVRVEGNDVDAISEVAGEAIERARSGQGPSLLEIHTVRLWGHFEGDAQAYRGAELDTLDERDPIPPYAERLKAAGVLTDADVASIADEMSAEIEAAVQFAKSSPEPAGTDALDHVFA